MIEGLLLVLTLLLCIVALCLSALAFSGTWVVLLAALITFFSVESPTLGTLILFTLLCIGTELAEAVAGWLGVQKRGGSKLAGFASLIGGVLGAILGSAVFPILGTLLGMLIGSFALAFLVEWNRLKHHRQAVRIAWGTVLARLSILFIKTIITLGMSIWLILALKS